MTRPELMVKLRKAKAKKQVIGLKDGAKVPSCGLITDMTQEIVTLSTHRWGVEYGDVIRIDAITQFWTYTPGPRRQVRGK